MVGRAEVSHSYRVNRLFCVVEFHEVECVGTDRLFQQSDRERMMKRDLPRVEIRSKQLQIDIRIISEERKLEGTGVRRPCRVYMLFFFLLFFFVAILRTVESKRRTDVA